MQWRGRKQLLVLMGVHVRRRASNRRAKKEFRGLLQISNREVDCFFFESNPQLTLSASSYSRKNIRGNISARTEDLIGATESA